MYRLFAITLFAATSIFVSTHAIASSFRAMPLRLHLNNEAKTEVLKIVNEENQPVTVQIGVKSWSQDANGKDQYDDTGEVVVFPKMATIEGGGTKIFRIGYNGKPVTTERTYRVFVQELPVNKPGESALKFALNLSLPVFVEPQRKRLMWSANVVGMKPEAVQVIVENNGSGHLMVNKIKATGLDSQGKTIFTEEQTGWYTLSGATRTYEVPVPYQQCLQAEKLNIDIEAKGATKHLVMPIEQGMCNRKPTSKRSNEKTYRSGSNRQ